eukprot:6405951-Amphidinium_carterae.3
MTKSQPNVHHDERYGADVDRTELELECLRQHWRGIYWESAMPSDAPVTDLLAFALRVNWPAMTVTMQRTSQSVYEDCLTVRHRCR